MLRLPPLRGLDLLAIRNPEAKIEPTFNEPGLPDTAKYHKSGLDLNIKEE